MHTRSRHVLLITWGLSFRLPHLTSDADAFERGWRKAGGVEVKFPAAMPLGRIDPGLVTYIVNYISRMFSGRLGVTQHESGTTCGGACTFVSSRAQAGVPGSPDYSYQ
jgi:hypothetical protein